MSATHAVLHSHRQHLHPRAVQRAHVQPGQAQLAPAVFTAVHVALDSASTVGCQRSKMRPCHRTGSARVAAPAATRPCPTVAVARCAQESVTGGRASAQHGSPHGSFGGLPPPRPPTRRPPHLVVVWGVVVRFFVFRCWLDQLPRCGAAWAAHIQPV